MNKKPDYRLEKDQQGEMPVPVGALWGIQTARARESFNISGQKPHPKLIDATVHIKKAAALTNVELGRLPAEPGRAIAQAADEVLNGQWRDHFIVDPFQPGGGILHNANVNEVLANRACEILGGMPGTYTMVSPNAHVNMAQSANDLFPSAMRLAILLELREFEPVMLDLERLLRRKALEFDRVVKVGRPHLRDSLPLTLGQEFNAYGSSIEHSLKRLRAASQCLTELNIGATAVGSGLSAGEPYTTRIVDRLSQATGARLRAGEDFFRLSQSASDFLEFSAALRALAAELVKIANDLRILSSGPRTGFGEIVLPELVSQPHVVADSLLPGTQLPALPECLVMVAYQVMGNDATVALCAQSGQLECNVTTPLVIHCTLQSLELLKNVLISFNQRCLAGIAANAARCKELLEATEAPLLALAAQVGLEKARVVYEEAQATGKQLKEIVLETQLVPGDEVDKLLSCKNVTQASARIDA